jgi:hypothetical protein
MASEVCPYFQQNSVYSLSARLFLKEACGFAEFISILFMLAGITCVIKPPFLFPGEEAGKDR